jgi:hypothetical protein
MMTNTSILISIIAPWFVSFLLLCIGSIALLHLPRLFALVKKNPLPVSILLSFCIIGALIRFQWVPNEHKINFDEDRYLSYAVTFAKFGQATNINLATPEKLMNGVPDSAGRVTVPVINAWMLKFFGYSEQVLFTGAKIASIIQILLMFILAYLLTKKYIVALIASAGVAFLPPIVFWSVSTNLDLYFVSFAILTLIASCWYGTTVTIKSTLFLLSSIMLLLFVRFEGLLLLPVVAILILCQRREKKYPLLTSKDLWFLTISFVFIGLRILMSLSVFGNPWCCGEGTPLETFRIGHLIRNTLPNLKSLFFQPEFPAFITIFALIALIQNKKWYVWMLGLWSILYFFLYSSYYAGKFFAHDFSGSYGRFFLMLIPPFVLLAATTIENLVLYSKKTSLRNKVMLGVIAGISILTLIPTIKQYKTMVSVSPYEWIVETSTRKFHKQLEDVFIAKTEPNAVLIHTLTSYTLLKGRTSVYIGSFIHDPDTIDFVIDKLEKGVPVYMIETDLCPIADTCQEKLKHIEQVRVLTDTYETYRIPIVQLKLKDIREP